MYRKPILLFVVCLQAQYLFCQKKTGSGLELQLRPSFGVHIPLNNLLKGDLNDHLISYDDHSLYWQVIALTMFFHKHWGIEFNYQAGTSRNIAKRADRFLEAMQAEYGNDYYVSPYTGAQWDNLNVILGHVERGYLGVIYRIESNRFFIYPKLSIGVSSFSADYGYAYLKEKKSNSVLRVYYSPDKIPQDHFTLAASTAIGYKLSKRIYLHADLLTSYYKTNLVFVKTITDQNTLQSIQEEHDYRKSLFNLSLGAGVIISLKKNRSNQ